MALDVLHPHGRLALGLFVSAALHLLWFGLLRSPVIPRLPSSSAEPAPLRLTLMPFAPRNERAAVSVPSAPVDRPRARQPAQPEPVRRAPPLLAPAPERKTMAPDVPSASPPGLAPAAPADAPHPSGADLLAAATRDAAAIARELNHAPGEKQVFHSRAREELDRRFEAAHAAGGSWFRSARIEEITTAADGNMRVYRIVTPLGAFCRTYPGNGGAPMNTSCPR
jgi:hypothetical protein